MTSSLVGSEMCIRDRSQRGQTKVFIDESGKSLPYFGMPIGGEHDWKYQDSSFIETFIDTGKRIKWKAKNVRWREMKVHKDRW
eukprot:4317688-Prorocentrum_lima.AAC.1